MDKVLVTTYFLQGVKQALSGDEISKRSCRSGANNYLDKANDYLSNLKDLKSIVGELENTTEREIMLVAVNSLIQQEKGKARRRR